MCHLRRNQCHNKHFLDVPAFIIAIHCHLSHPLQSIHLSIVIKYQDAVCRNLLLPSRFPSVGLSNCYIQWSWTVEQLGLWKFWISLCLSTPPGLQVWILPSATMIINESSMHIDATIPRVSRTEPQRWSLTRSIGQAGLIAQAELVHSIA